MKHFGSILDFTKERNNDLLHVYRTRLKEAGFIVMPDIFQLVANSPARRFYVSEERASIVISAMLSGNKLTKMRSNKREMFNEIFRRFLILRKQKPNSSVYDLVSEIVQQPAPKFYLTARTVGEFIYRIKNGWYEKRNNRNR